MEEIDFLISVFNKIKKENKEGKDFKDNKENITSQNTSGRDNLVLIPKLNTRKVNNKSNEEKEYKNKIETEGYNIGITVLPDLFNICWNENNLKRENNKIINKRNLKPLPKLFQDEEEKYNMSNINSNFTPKMRYLDFRPYLDNLDKKPKTPKDSGYYYIMLGTECPLVKNLLEDNGLVEVTNLNKEWIVMWSSGSIKSHVYHNLKKYQKVNHFPKSSELTRKDCLYKNVSKLQTMFPNLAKILSFIPQSFILPNEIKFLEEEMEKDYKVVWIVKPVSSSQGRGIYVTNNIQEIPSGMTLIVSKYIPNPYLIDGFKFDLRIYVLMTSVTPLRIYIFEEGFARFATEKYYLGQPFKSNKFIHLTNYAVNKMNKNFVPNTDPFIDNVGSKWSLNALKKYFTSIKVNSEEIFNKIEDVVIKTIISAENSLVTSYLNSVNVKNSCFELFGFDILLDSNINPWLMEVNLSPSLHCDSPLDVKIKGELIAECLDITRVFPFDMRDKENEYIKQSTNISLENKILRETSHLYVMKDFKFTKEVREILWDTDEEFSRLKKFKRIFPSETSLNYRKFFQNENPINLVLSMKALENKNKNGKIKKLNLINKAKTK